MPLAPGGPSGGRSAPVEVAPGVYVFTSRREHTTSTLVLGTRSNALLVDPAWEPDELAAIAADLAGRAVVVEAGFATHAHHDHVLWHPRFGPAPRYASAATVSQVTRDRKALVAAMGPDWPRKLAKLVGRLEPPPSDGRLLGAEPIELITHNAHRPGHTALWLESRRVLIAGDMLSDVEPPLPYYDDNVAERAQLVAYLAGLDAIAPYIARTDVLIPGHGSPTDRPMSRLDADRRYVDELLAAP